MPSCLPVPPGRDRPSPLLPPEVAGAGFARCAWIVTGCEATLSDLGGSPVQAVAEFHRRRKFSRRLRRVPGERASGCASLLVPGGSVPLSHRVFCSDPPLLCDPEMGSHDEVGDLLIPRGDPGTSLTVGLTAVDDLEDPDGGSCPVQVRVRGDVVLSLDEAEVHARMVLDAVRRGRMDMSPATKDRSRR